MSRIDVDGLRLNVEAGGNGPCLLLLHGFTGSIATWAPFLEAWSGFKTIAVDIVGHGESDNPREIDRYRMDRCVRDMVALLDRLNVQETAVLGYSMGGRLALHLALWAPERLRALVLESASPGIEDACDRAARVQSDAELAESIERDGIESFVKRWEALPLFASQRALPSSVREALRSQRLRNQPLGLANSLCGMGAGAQKPVLDRLCEITVPTLLLSGARDERYCELAQRMAERMPNAHAVVVPDAGHAVHLEQPDAFSLRVREFLDRCGGPTDEREE